VFRDEPHQEIIDPAKKSGCDLIVMGSHGYGGLKQLVLGSETTRVLSHSKIPVLVYR
jgi:nucleotide-binding universal stress UspA family protein